MFSLISKFLAVKIFGGNGIYAADVVLEDGIKKLATTKKVNVESLSGVQEAATNYFFIESVADGQTLTIDITATEIVPAFNKTFTVEVGEDKYAFATRIILELNQDFLGWQKDYKALSIKDNAAVYVLAKTIGEAGEALAIDDFLLSGTVPTQRGFDNLQRRSSVVQASLSVKDPRLAIFGISGVVESRDASVEGLIVVQPYTNDDPLDIEMSVNGTGTPVEYTFPMDLLDDFFISEVRFFGLGNGIQFTKFLSLNSALTNGIEVEIKTDNEILLLPLIKTTEDFADKFAFGGGDNFQLYIQSGADKFLAAFTTASFPLRRAGTHGIGNDDYIKIRINDNLNSLIELQAAVVGFRQEA